MKDGGQRAGVSPTTRVLIAVASGLAAGIALAAIDPSWSAAVVAVVEPFGTIWLRALQMTVVPLVVSLLVTGVAVATDVAATGRLAVRTLLLFTLLLSIAAAFAAITAGLAFRLWPADADRFAVLRGQTMPVADVPGFGAWLTAIVPANPIRAAADGAILPLVVFGLFFGFALTRIEATRRDRLVELFQAVVDAMMVVVAWVLWAAPLGVFGLTLPVGALLGVGVLGAVASYVVVTSIICIILTAALYPVAVVWGRLSLAGFARAVAPAQTVAFSTQSSMASLPAMLDATQVRLGLPPRVTGFVLPLAVSLFRITSPPAYLAGAAFTAWLYGLDVSPIQLATGAAVGVVISFGAVSLPNQVSFVGTQMPVLQAMGLPLEALGLMLAVSSIPDLFQTVGNVTADVTVAAIVSRTQCPPRALES